MIRGRTRLIHIILFLLTFLFTLYTGIAYFILFHDIALPKNTSLLAFILRKPAAIFWGLSYSLALMAIFLFHEMGHYVACRRHRIRATLPYFLPAPPAISLSGTFGAVIKIQEPITSKRALFDIGLAGPLAGFIVAIPVICAGISLSRVVDVQETDTMLSLGDPLLFQFLTRLIKGPLAAKQTVLLHPVAFAGWFGLLATSINLFPIGQLDGGHILYSLFGRRTYYVGIAFVAVLILLGIFYWPGWLAWALLVSLIGYRHPPVHEEERIDRTRRVLSLAPLLVFLLSFTPTPFSLSF